MERVNYWGWVNDLFLHLQPGRHISVCIAGQIFFGYFVLSQFRSNQPSSVGQVHLDLANVFIVILQSSKAVMHFSWHLSFAFSQFNPVSVLLHLSFIRFPNIIHVDAIFVVLHTCRSLLSNVLQFITFAVFSTLLLNLQTLYHFSFWGFAISRPKLCLEWIAVSLSAASSVREKAGQVTIMPTASRMVVLETMAAMQLQSNSLF